MEQKVKVVWITCFSNEVVRRHLRVSIPFVERIVRRVLNKPAINVNADTCIWNTNAIIEFEKFKEVELHIVAPYYYMKESEQFFEYNGVFYHFFKDECDYLGKRLQKRFGKGTYEYNKNTQKINALVRSIKPDIVHYIGAENPHYDMSIFEIPSNIPTIVQLQTLMSEKGFFEKYPISKKEYFYRSDIERQVIERADYIGVSAEHFKEVIFSQMKLDKKFLDIYLALTEQVDSSISNKDFDFVYFANDISKAVDVVLEAFAILCKGSKSLTLDLIGGCSSDVREGIELFLKNNGLSNNVKIEGRLPTHDDVLNQIKKAKIAVLPLKVDLISGTIREAMACGIPVVSTITPETPKLNEEKQCILLSELGDIDSFANNMEKLLNSQELYNEIRDNALEIAANRKSNYELMRDWVKAYFMIKNKCV